MKNLALLGLGTTYLIDLDVVEPSNLSRSVLFREEDGGQSQGRGGRAAGARAQPRDHRSSRLHGDVITDLGLGLFADVDLVIGCLDNREARLWVNRQCWKTGTPWIDAGIQEIQGVVKVFVPPDSACYECAMTERDYQLLNLRYSCPLLTRDQISAGKVPTAPTIASMMAALQVQEALKLLHGMPVAAGSALVFNGVANQFYSTRLPFRDDCLSHETYPEPVELPLGRGKHGAELFAAARPALAGTASPGAGPRAGRRGRLPAVPLAWRGHAAAGQGQGVRGGLPELPRAGPARVRERGRRRFAPGRRAAFPRRHSPLRYRAGRRAEPNRAFSSWPRTEAEGNTGWGSGR